MTEELNFEFANRPKEKRISKDKYRANLIKMLDHLERGKHIPIITTQCNYPSNGRTMCEVTYYYEIEERDDY